jgi:hypothetical protein
MNNIETLRHRIRVHIANREHYSKVEFLDKLHEILHESEQPGAQPAPVHGPSLTDLAAAIEYADARWSGVDVPIEWARHFADAIGKPCTTPPAAQPAVPDAIHHTDLSEHPQYIEGWNDCRAEMLKGMK